MEGLHAHHYLNSHCQISTNIRSFCRKNSVMDTHTISTEITSHTPYSHNHKHLKGISRQSTSFQSTLNTVNSTKPLPNPFNSSSLPNPQTIKMTAFLPSLSRLCTVFDGFSQLKNRHIIRSGQQFDGFFPNYCQNSSIIFDLGTN